MIKVVKHDKAIAPENGDFTVGHTKIWARYLTDYLGKEVYSKEYNHIGLSYFRGHCNGWSVLRDLNIKMDSLMRACRYEDYFQTPYGGKHYSMAMCPIAILTKNVDQYIFKDDEGEWSVAKFLHDMMRDVKWNEQHNFRDDPTKYDTEYMVLGTGATDYCRSIDGSTGTDLYVLTLDNGDLVICHVNEFYHK